jgi:hypothetical protein
MKTAEEILRFKKGYEYSELELLSYMEEYAGQFMEHDSPMVFSDDPRILSPLKMEFTTDKGTTTIEIIGPAEPPKE